MRITVFPGAVQFVHGSFIFIQRVVSSLGKENYVRCLLGALHS